eukprot:TRINITY_DN16553_c0_g1_i1.p1 TRINITY_DN16553_c0_g1~~TRINITY_DN16553_c0_g1_i1.p1  ORF type:complete len:1184 (+),score=403.22 TRINITY_DN16553_c0_g1_i1:296-3553(+)
MARTASRQSSRRGSAVASSAAVSASQDDEEDDEEDEEEEDEVTAESAAPARRRRNFAPAANLTKVLQDATRVAEALGKAQKARKEREDRVKDTIEEAKAAGLIVDAPPRPPPAPPAPQEPGAPAAGPTPQDHEASPAPEHAMRQDSVSLSLLASPAPAPEAPTRHMSAIQVPPPSSEAMGEPPAHACTAPHMSPSPTRQREGGHRTRGPQVPFDPYAYGGGYSAQPMGAYLEEMHEDVGDFYEDGQDPGTDTQSSPTSDFFFTSEQITGLCEERHAAAQAGNARRAEEIRETLWRQGIELDDAVGKWVASDGRLGHYEYAPAKPQASPAPRKIDDETYNRLLGKKLASERRLNDAAVAAVAVAAEMTGAEETSDEVRAAVQKAAAAAGVDGDVLATITLTADEPAPAAPPRTPGRLHRTPPPAAASHLDPQMDPHRPFTEAYCDTGYSSIHPQTPERISPTHVDLHMLDGHLQHLADKQASEERHTAAAKAAAAGCRDDEEASWTTPPGGGSSPAHSRSFTSASAQPGPPFAPGERLYYKSAALERLKQEKLERQREAKAQSERDLVTKPKITALAKTVTGGFHERQAEWEKKMKTNREEAKVLMESQHKRSEMEQKRLQSKRAEVVNKRPGAGKGPVAEWHQRAEKYSRKRAEPQPEAASYQPKITQAAAKMAGRGNAAERLYSDAASRRVRLEAKVNEEAERSQYDRATGQLRYTPQTTAASHPSTSPPRSPPGHGQVRGGVLFTRVAKGESQSDQQEAAIHRLLSQGQMATRRRAQREAALNEVEHAKPQMSRMSKEINQRIPRRPLYETASREQSGGVQHGSVLFSKSNGKSDASSVGDFETRTVCSMRSTGSFGEFAQRSAMHEKQRVLKLERMRRSKEVNEMANCTFAPKVSKNSHAIFKLAEQRGRSQSSEYFERDGPPPPLPYVEEEEYQGAEDEDDGYVIPPSPTAYSGYSSGTAPGLNAARRGGGDPNPPPYRSASGSFNLSGMGQQYRMEIGDGYADPASGRSSPAGQGGLFTRRMRPHVEVEADDDGVEVEEDGGAGAGEDGSYLMYAHSAQEALSKWRRVSHHLPESEDEGP